LGLSTVYGIVKQNNGFIHVYSEPGVGTTLRIYIPRHGESAVKTSTTLEAELPRGEGETVLLVEDEQDVRKMARNMLEAMGYSVLEATTSIEAIRLAQEHPGKIDLLMTDVVMPGMNGKELAERILANDPGMKCLFTSGYTADVIAHHGVLEEGVHFIQKPHSMLDLAIKVSEVLVEE
jgi:response regulator RpfG family c-di-GMP phosphodiesterase